MKRIRFFVYNIIFFWLFAWSQSYANISDFWEKLININIPIHDIISNTGISRYELTRLLSATECNDCVVTPPYYRARYNQNFWETFTKTPGKDFNDILYGQAIFNKKSHYYCVAYVWEKWYMKWYPKETSPICAWSFCWDRFTTKAEFLQVIINIISKYLYQTYSINWNNTEIWINKLRSASYEYKTFTKSEIDTIKNKSKECWKNNCSIKSTEEFNIYLKYCMFNLKSCNMIPFGKIKEWYRPVAELNVLYRQNLISLDDALKYTLWDNIDWKLAIDILGKVNKLIWCSFDLDYDCDWIPNHIDNCPYHFNPQQRDLDNDGIWNVCDEDIDGDGIKNAIGIVDDNDNISIRLWDKSMDNCLFIKNPDQKSTIKNWFWDVCVDKNNHTSLTINIQKIDGSKTKTVTFWAISEWPANNFQWDFWDWSIGSGKIVSHTYFLPWLYNVRLFAKWDNTNDAFAKTTVIIGRDENEKQGLYPLNTSLIVKNWWEWNFTISSLGNHDSYQWTIWNTTTSTKTPNIKKKFVDNWSFPIIVKAINKDSIVAATMFSIWVGDNNYWSMLIPSDMLINKYDNVNFDTKLSNFNNSSISRIFWDFWDWTTKETLSTKISHTYQSVWKKIVLQIIHLRDWTKLQNMVTVFVSATNLFYSYWIQLLPSNLNLSASQNFSFSLVPIWDSFSDLLFANIIAWDWSSHIFGINNKTSFPLKKDFSYRNPWIYYPQANFAIDQCSQLSAQSTLAVWWQDFCLQAKLDWTLSKYKCDMDKDGIPDICDDDIDWDGIKNLLWIIKPWYTNNCNYIEEINKKNQNLINNLVNIDILQKHFKWVCSLDNDPFNQNNDQLDNNKNNIWDSLEKLINNIWLTDIISPIVDSDWDWIPDDQDLCPFIPETWNWITDFDWCPELWLEFYCDNYRSPINTSFTDSSWISPTSFLPAGIVIPKGFVLKRWTNIVWWATIANWSIISQPTTFPIWTILPGWAILPDWTILPGWTIITGWIVLSGWAFVINNNADITTWYNVTLNINVNWATHMKFGNTTAQRDSANRVTYNNTYPRTLTGADWEKTVYAMFSGNWIIPYIQDDIYLDTTISKLPTEYIFPIWTILPGWAILPDWIITEDILLPWDTEFTDGLSIPNDQTWSDISWTCGNGIQDLWENCQTCPQDVEDCLFVATNICLQCPCPFIDKNTNLSNKDNIKAVLRDYKKEYPRRYSIGYQISI
jgi:hypothetical protein